MNNKERLDVTLVKRGLVVSRERARAIIMSGIVFVDNQKEEKAGTLVNEKSLVEIRGKVCPYVSRGGLKLEKALDFFGYDPKGKICADIGASTGGFTDCLLKRGASRVYAVDVGYGQLAWSIRTDPRVVCLERTNIRYVTNEQIPEKLDFSTVDVSFISLKLVLPVVNSLLSDKAYAICLIKPQFEAGREKVGKKGVVSDPAVHEEVLNLFIGNSTKSGFFINGITFSPIKGPEGNIEYLGFLSKTKTGFEPDIPGLVAESHKELI